MTSRHLDASRPLALRVLAIATAAILCLGLTAGTAYAAIPYNPLDVISEENWRDVSSMSQADIQAFLEAPLPGEGPSVLAKYSGPELGEHGGAIKPASQIIWEACQAYNLNPKVILATLEKEQSLITQHVHYKSSKHSHGTDYHIKYALGVGVYAGSSDWHPGFGDQVWGSARRFGQLAGVYSWKAGQVKNVHSYPDGGRHIDIVPLNGPTWALYTYTPYYPQVSFWNYYVKFFGDPHALPRVKSVYQFIGRRTGAYLYTASEAERYSIMARASRTWRFQGVAFTIDTSGTTNVSPLYRLYNTRTGRYTFTASTSERDKLLRLRYRRRAYYRLQGVTTLVSLTAEPGASPVYRLYNTRKNTFYFATSLAQANSLLRIRRGGWKSKGIAFYRGVYTPPTSTVASPPVAAVSTVATPAAQ
ncbi:MAG: hypothetical protein Q7W16_07115 [Coriobacteriia bacterium]|nr:hypothetical protein [Coriobacteriia bacterium]